MATADGTWAYRDRFGDEFGRTYFRRFGDGVVSSLGIGTYLGEPTDVVDDEYEESITTALENGCNVLDTAINYRHQRSERVVGRALAEADVEREEVLVATKGGFLPFDGERPADPGEYVREEYVEPGIVPREELVRGSHCIAPGFIENQLDRSLDNLDLGAIDLYYVHNPEAQLEERSRKAVYDRLEETFTRLEERVAAGDLRYYGVATWDAFRVHPEHANHLSLPEVASRARAAAKEAGNTATHLRAIQLPFNVHMADGFTVEAHEGAEGAESALWFAQKAGLNAFASASIGQGRLAEGLPESVAERLEGESSAGKAINFARSAPGVTSALVGASSREHVRENLDACRFDPMGAEAFDRVFE
ncbi:aldo/keto reductase [Halalkalicoccus tibetensis]|uniref:Aldo/keto reductase n=1 Tax=Halalkalicoccus tibetensis TaxID=175632 RepID=A0ABD5V4J0_9EURY